MSLQEFFTKKNWKEYEREASTQAMYGYMEATEHFIPELKRILLCETFSEMKDQLTELCSNRDEFVEEVAKTLGKPKKKQKAKSFKL